MKKKGPVKIFVILALITLIFFSIFAYLNAREVNQVVSGALKESVKDFALGSAFEDCVIEKSEFVIDMLFKQGGVLYESQGGIISNPEISFALPVDQRPEFPRLISSFDGLLVNYGLINEIPFIYEVSKNFKKAGVFNGLDTVSEVSPTGIFNQKNNPPYFGTINMPKLCNRDGPNGPHESSKFSCLPQLYNTGSLDENFTIQSQLNNVLSKKIITCVDDETLKNYFDFNYEGDGSVSVVFTDKSIIIRNNITLVQNIQGSTKKINKDYELPLRLKKLYTLGYLIVEKDSKNIFFEKDKDYKDIDLCEPSCWDEKIFVKLTESFIETSNPDYAYDDVLTLEDRDSEITNLFTPNYLGEQEVAKRGFLQLNIPFENRRPFLETITNQPSDRQKSGYDYAEDYGLGTSLSPQDRTFYFLFKILDPDENDAKKMYNKTLGHVSILRLGDPLYTYFSTTGNLENGPFTNPFNSINISQSLGPQNISHILSCKNHCYLSQFQGKPYSPSIYTFQASANDGEFEDYQIFNITINP